MKKQLHSDVASSDTTVATLEAEKQKLADELASVKAELETAKKSAGASDEVEKLRKQCADLEKVSLVSLHRPTLRAF